MYIEKKEAIVAYKAFNSDWTCRDFQYEVGKSYTHEGEIILCTKGFHCCKKLRDCFNYYKFDPTVTRIAEVRIWGSVIKDNSFSDSKLVANHIEIVEELDWEYMLSVCNSGEDNTGLANSGCNNSGKGNTAVGNAGSFNSGSLNWGRFNSGHNNTGNYNSGDHNSGNLNVGSYNSGDRNIGWWNSGSGNSGYFNTQDKLSYSFFNKRTAVVKTSIRFPEFLKFQLTKWIYSENMTDKEKKENPGYEITGGYLKKRDYKEALRESFLRYKYSTSWPSELARLKSLPNFDPEIFYEISGIKPEELE